MADYSEAYRSFGNSTSTVQYVTTQTFNALEKRVLELEERLKSMEKVKTAGITGDLLGRIEQLEEENERLEAENMSLRQSLLDVEEKVRGALG